MAYKPIASVMGRDLLWMRPRLFTRMYELRTAHDIIATLRFVTRRSAVAETAEGVFRFEERRGPFMKIQIFRGDEAIGDVAFKFRSGALTMADGRVFPLRGSGPFGFSLHVRDQKDRFQLIRTSKRPFAFMTPGSVDVGSSGWASPELPLLAALTWYMVVMRARRAAARS